MMFLPITKTFHPGKTMQKIRFMFGPGIVVSATTL